MVADYQGKDSLVGEEGEAKYEPGGQPDETTLAIGLVFSSRDWKFRIAVNAIPCGAQLVKNPEPVKNLDEIKEE